MKQFLSKIGSRLTRARVKFLEWQYGLHLRVRFLHDSTYEKVRWYKQWNDKKYSSAVHKATLVAFIVSFAVFSGLQNLFPYFFNLGKPRPALAGAEQVTWTTQGDFNATSPKTNVSITGD